jgi:hypothetical protein
MLDYAVNGARERREAIRQLAELRRRLAAEETPADALAAMKSAEGAFDTANDRFDAAERALDEAREERAQARRERYAARQAHDRAAITADRLQRRVTDLTGWLAELRSTALRPGMGGREGPTPRSSGPAHASASTDPGPGSARTLPSLSVHPVTGARAMGQRPAWGRTFGLAAQVLEIVF